MKIFIILVVLILPSPLLAGGYSTWTDNQRELWWTYTILGIIDLGQTRDIAQRPDEYREKVNEFFLGKHPGVGRVHNTFLFTYVSTYILVSVLPDDLGELLLVGKIMVETYCVGRNNAIGLNVNLKF